MIQPSGVSARSGSSAGQPIESRGKRLIMRGIGASRRKHGRTIIRRKRDRFNGFQTAKDHSSSSAIVHGVFGSTTSARRRTNRAARGGKATTIRMRLGSSIAATIAFDSTVPLQAGAPCDAVLRGLHGERQRRQPEQGTETVHDGAHGDDTSEIGGQRLTLFRQRALPEALLVAIDRQRKQYRRAHRLELAHGEALPLRTREALDLALRKPVDG